MADNLLTPNMFLPNPIPGSSQGPQYALDIQSCFTLVDQHNHSTGQGVPITPAGLSIITDLPFGSNNATLLRSVRFTPQSAALALAADVGCLYVVNNELFYNDVTGGHQIAITSNGSVNAGAGSINGLPSGTASASFSAGTFVWQSATATAANMDAGSYIFRNATANSKGLTLQPPAAMGADFSLTLPSVPAAQNFMALDASGNMSAYAPVAQGIQKTNLAPLGQQISSSCGAFSTTANSFTNVTNLLVTITTTGRPVMVIMQPVAGFTGTYADTGFVQCTGPGAVVRMFRDSTPISDSGILGSDGNYSTFTVIDTPTAGTYNYAVQALAISGSVTIHNWKLAVYEL